MVRGQLDTPLLKRAIMDRPVFRTLPRNVHIEPGLVGVLMPGVWAAASQEGRVRPEEACSWPTATSLMDWASGLATGTQEG